MVETPRIRGQLMSNTVKLVGWSELLDSFEAPERSMSRVTRLGTYPLFMAAVEVVGEAAKLLPHTGPTSVFAVAAQYLRNHHNERTRRHAIALGEVIELFRGDDRFQVALDFNAIKAKSTDRLPETGVWFTRRSGSELFLFWHPDAKLLDLMLKRLSCVHYGRGGNFADRIRMQSILLGGVFTS
jgi:hypothetical protein